MKQHKTGEKMKTTTNEQAQIIKILATKYKDELESYSSLILDIKDGSFVERADFVHQLNKIRSLHMKGRSGPAIHSKNPATTKIVYKDKNVTNEDLLNEPEIVPLHKVSWAENAKQAKYANYLHIEQLRGWNKMTGKQKITALLKSKDIPKSIILDLVKFQFKELTNQQVTI